MDKVYDRIYWENYPNTTSPLNANNMNKMDSAIDELDDRIVELYNNLISSSINENINDYIQTYLSEHPVTVSVKDEALTQRVTDLEGNRIRLAYWLNENNQVISNDDKASVRHLAVVYDGSDDGSAIPTTAWIQGQVGALVSTIPTKTSQLTNDSKYVSQTAMNQAMNQASEQIAGTYVTQAAMQEAMNQAFTQVQSMITEALGGIENGSY